MKRALKIGVFLILLTGAYWYVNGVLKVKFENSVQLYIRKRQDIDVFSVGSSHVYCTIDPVTVWKETGIPSYVFAAGSQPLWNSYYYIKEGLKYQNPGVIILEVYGTSYDVEYSQWNEIQWNTMGLKLSKEKVESVWASSPDKREALLWGFPIYHTRYKELTKRDFVDSYAKDTEYRNGYSTNEKIFKAVPQTRPDADTVNTTAAKELHPKALEYFLKIIELAKERGIPLVLIAAPYALPASAQESFNSVARIAKENTLRFINYNTMYDELEIDFDTDFFDSHHLNYHGAQKISRHLAALLAEEYGLPDRRNDPAYADWNVWAETFTETPETAP
jgi:hypothetical protein